MLHNLKLFFFYIARAFGLFAIAKHLTAMSPRILCYHGGSLGDEWQYNGLLFMRRTTFAKRIDWLERNGFKFISLDQAIGNPSSDRSNCPSVVLTFDDGWYSTGRELLSLLAENNIPSVLYLSTNYFQEGHSIIPVALGYLLWKSEKREFQFNDIDVDIDGTYDTRIPSERNRLISAITHWASTKSSDKQEVTKLIEKVAAHLDVPIDTLALETRRFDYLNAEEISFFSKNGCAIELHGHLHHYPVGEPGKFEQDLDLCTKVIRELQLAKPKHYCYPGGVFDSAAAGILMRRGVISATTCLPGLMNFRRPSDNYYLPRFLDGEQIHMLEFEAEMSGFTALLRYARV
jgi:peptidoglycan/xylan/chitin deacetylase (PgdA/CDA1 family)